MKDQAINREWQFVRQPEQVNMLLRDKIKKADFYLKGTKPPAEVYRGPAQDDGKIELHYAPDLILADNLTLYTTLNRQLEIDFKVDSRPEDGTVIANPKEARISVKQREDRRVPVLNNSVSASHFQVSRSDLAIDNTRPQVANKVVYNEFEKSLSREIPGLKIYDYAKRDRPQETRLLNRETKAILVTDTNDPGAYHGHHPDTLNFEELLEEEDLLEQKKKEYLNNQIQSVLAMPILYDMANGSRRPIAFFYATTPRGESLDPSILARLNEASEEIIARIQDANMLNIPDRQPVLDISEHGVALELTQPELMKYVPNSRVLTFDLIFKMQAPLRFLGRVRHMLKEGNSLIVGLSLDGTGHHAGSNSKNPLDRLKSLINLVENG